MSQDTRRTRGDFTPSDQYPRGFKMMRLIFVIDFKCPIHEAGMLPGD